MTPNKDKGVLRVEQRESESVAEALASTLSMPEFQAAQTIRQWQNPALPDGMRPSLNETSSELEKQSKALQSGDMTRAEQMLITQAHTLDELFNNLARRAASQERLSHFEAFLKLAFKAQNQCRMTLESLSNIKNPPVVYAKQANIAHGPQQVNNGVSPHAAKNQNEQSKLLEVNHGERLDTGTTGETIGGNQKMEAVGEQHRAEN